MTVFFNLKLLRSHIESGSKVPTLPVTPPTAAREMSQTENPGPVANTTKAPADDLSTESIGWLFIQKYYSTYTSECNKLFSFYGANASLLHDGFPKSDVKTVNQAVGIDAIKTFFTTQAESTEQNKIVVSRADFQRSVEGSILIVVCGSWIRETAMWQFVQTFVLSEKAKAVYDIANDVMKVFDFSDLEEKPVVTNEVRAEAEKEAAVAEPVENGRVEEATEKPEDKEVRAEVEEVAVSEPKAPAAASAPVPAASSASPAASRTPSAPVEKAEPEKASKDTKAEAKAEAKAETKAEAKPAPKNSEKPTWANLAAIEPKNPPKNTVVATTAAKTATVAAAPVKKPAQASATAAPTATAPLTATQQHQNGNKFRKEEWYPIYIRNVEVTEEELTAALIKQFGDIKFFKKSNRAALCDFRRKEDQQKALEAKEIVVNGNVILLEPRVHKPFNGNKAEFKKDKKVVKKNGLKKN